MDSILNYLGLLKQKREQYFLEKYIIDDEWNPPFANKNEIISIIEKYTYFDLTNTIVDIIDNYEVIKIPIKEQIIKILCYYPQQNIIYPIINLETLRDSRVQYPCNLKCPMCKNRNILYQKKLNYCFNCGIGFTFKTLDHGCGGIEWRMCAFATSITILGETLGGGILRFKTCDDFITVFKSARINISTVLAPGIDYNTLQ